MPALRTGPGGLSQGSRPTGRRPTSWPDRSDSPSAPPSLQAWAFSAGVRVQVSVNAGQADLDLAGMQVPSVSASVNAGAANLDLSSSLALERVSASVNAGSLSIALPAPTGTIEGSASVNAGTLELCVPPGTPLRVRVGGSPLGAHNLGDRGLVQDDEVWTTPGSAGAAAVVSLNLSVNLGSFTLDPEDGCD